MASRRPVCCCALVAAALLPCGEAAAQYRGYGFGFYPFYQYNGFYSNGFSMYGPPVPTYAPVPGMFGGSSQHSYAGPGWFVPRHPATPPGPDGPVMVRVRPAQPTATPEEPDRLPPPRKLNLDAEARIDVRLPDGAAVVAINGQATRQAGTSRTFTSPPLEVGRVFVYEVQARWQANGKAVEESRTLAVEAGKTFVVDFTTP